MIVARGCGQVTIERLATMADIRPIAGREPTPQDHDAIAHRELVVVRFGDPARSFGVKHTAGLLATGGPDEIRVAVEKAIGS